MFDGSSNVSSIDSLHSRRIDESCLLCYVQVPALFSAYVLQYVLRDAIAPVPPDADSETWMSM
jgi:hypothetical protein